MDRTSYRGRRPQQGYERERLEAHWDGVPDEAIDLARECSNAYCVQCGAESFGGGLRCAACFLKVARPIRRQRRGPHPEPSVPYVELGRAS